MQYIGVKKFIESFKEPFDRIGKATSIAKKKIKDRGERATKELLKEEIDAVLLEWDNKTKLGERVHNKLVEKERNNPNVIVEGYRESVGEIEIDDLEAHIINKLENNKIYLEKQIVSNHNGIIGYSDRVEVKNNYINITDTKTWNKIYRSSSYIAENGFKIPATYFDYPLQDMQVCNFNEAALQLSLYMYILWTYNKKLKPGKLWIRHIELTESGRMKSEGKLIPVPYLRSEVKAMIKNKRINW